MNKNKIEVIGNFNTTNEMRTFNTNAHIKYALKIRIWSWSVSCMIDSIEIAS